MADPSTSADDAGSDSSTKPVAPPRASVNVADLITAYDNQQNTVQTSLNDLSNVAKLISSGGGGGGAYTEYAGQTAVNQANIEAAVKLKTDNAEAAAKFGVTPGAWAPEVSALSQAVNDHDSIILSQMKKIDDLQGAKFADNPLGWLLNQIQLPFEQQRLSTLQDDNQKIQTEISNRLNLVTEAGKANSTIDTAAGQTLLAGMDKIALGQAQQKAAESALKTAQLGIEIINVRQNMSDSQFRGMVTLNNAFAQQQDMVIRQGQYALQQEQAIRETLRSQQETTMFNINSENRQLALDSEKQFNTDLLRATTFMGMTPITYQQYQRMAPETRTMLDGIMHDPYLNEGRYGGTINKAVEVSMNAPGLPTGLRPVQQAIQTEKMRFLTGPEAILLKALPKDSQDAALEKHLNDFVGGQAKNITPTGNIYSPPSLKSVLSIGALVNSDGTQKTGIGADLAPAAVSSPQTATDPNLLIETAVSRVLQGRTTPQQAAAELATIFNAVKTDNNAQRQYQRLNIPTVGGTIVPGYNMQVYTGDLFNSTKVIDTTNPTAWESVILRRVQRKIQSDAMTNPSASNYQ